MTNSATTPAPTATAAASKRPAPAAAAPAAKRPRPSAENDGEDLAGDDDEPKEGEENEEEMDEEAKAKAARREARTIRNRESAQRSRNQRKAHLAWLEARVIELEAENRALRAGTAPSSPSKTRESSPAHSIVSLASDLGIPPEVVSAGGGVHLATVAPPPSDVLDDIKPVVPASPAPAMPEPHLVMMAPPQHPAELQEENMQLRYRVGLLESIVKQTAAYFSNNTPIDMHMMVASPAPLVMSRSHSHSRPSPGMDATLSPPMFPTQPQQSAPSPLRLKTKLENVAANQPASASVDVSSFVDLLPREARRGPAAGEGFLDRLQLGRAGEQGAFGNGGSTGSGSGAPQGLDLNIGSVLPPSASVQVADQAQDGWFAEGPQAVQWDEEMNDLLETLEGKTNGVSTSTRGGSAMPLTVAGGEQWAWETAMVEF